ncbi:MAG: tyrosine-type recombinase/integrase [Nanoarchaeota archaeon]|nr:tyrosine-type recombinase/integrase [Nanoarchaeota archaeon]
MLRRNYSLQTIKAYVFCMKKFLLWCGDKEPRRVTKYDIRNYLDWLCENKKSASTLNVHLQALKFALEQILNKRFFVNLPFSKVPNKLPEVLSQDEIVNLFKNIANPKHSLIVRLMYSAGLRVGEVVNLKVKDLEFGKRIGWVRKGKGNKDRPFLISAVLKPEIIEFIRKHGLEHYSWLFPGRKINHLTTRSVYEIVRQAGKRAGLNKNIHPHTLRHSFATHLIENGYDITRVQALLGHNSPETTMVYVHMASPEMINVSSPYDSLYDSPDDSRDDSL